MSRKFLLCVGAVLCALPLSAQEVWREGSNIAGLSFYKGTEAQVQLGSSFTSGDFRRPSEAASLWQAGVDAQAESHYKDMIFVGAFQFDVKHGHNMMGSMFTTPEFYPIDVLEFTPGPKTRQTYGVSGGMVWITRSRWVPGFTLEFQGINYSKRKDLRHTTYRQVVNFSPSLLYKGDRWNFGATLILNNNSEFVQAEQLGTATADTYYAFLDKGKRYGIYEAWDGSGIHLADPGVDRLAVNQSVWGLALQTSQQENFYADLEYRHSFGQVGEKGYTWFRFPGQVFRAKALWNIGGKKGLHTMRADLNWEGIDNYESVIDRVSAGGVTTPVEYAQNRIYVKRSIEFGPSYIYESNAGWKLGAATSLKIDTDRGTYMYPFLDLDGSTMLNLAVNGEFPIGPVTLTAQIAFRTEVAEKHEVIDTDESDEGIITYPFRLVDWWDLEEEFNDCTRLSGTLNVRYDFTIRKQRFFVEAGCNTFHGFGVTILPGSSRQTTHLTLGYKF
jgi:hypothetical protein